MVVVEVSSVAHYMYEVSRLVYLLARHPFPVAASGSVFFGRGRGRGEREGEGKAEGGKRAQGANLTEFSLHRCVWCVCGVQDLT